MNVSTNSVSHCTTAALSYFGIGRASLRFHICLNAFHGQRRGFYFVLASRWAPSFRKHDSGKLFLAFASSTFERFKATNRVFNVLTLTAQCRKHFDKGSFGDAFVLERTTASVPCKWSAQTLPGLCSKRMPLAKEPGILDTISKVGPPRHGGLSRAEGVPESRITVWSLCW